MITVCYSSQISKYFSDFGHDVRRMQFEAASQVIPIFSPIFPFLWPISLLGCGGAPLCEIANDFW